MHRFRENLALPDAHIDFFHRPVHGDRRHLTRHTHAFYLFAVLDHLGIQDAMVPVDELGLRKSLLELEQGQHGDVIDTDLSFRDPQLFEGGDEFLLDLHLDDPRVLHGCQGPDILLLHPIHRVPASLITAARREEERLFVRGHDAGIPGEKRDGPPQRAVARHVPYIFRLETKYCIEPVFLDLFIQARCSLFAEEIKVYPLCPVHCKIHFLSPFKTTVWMRSPPKIKSVIALIRPSGKDSFYARKNKRSAPMCQADIRRPIEA
ncbi:MAG: hypothetical protein ACD_75C01849G0001 [uncultured bacterium]|nr:MAG: hypothetical protein ACD_75C01849G0001 [uncultured bacterium]